MKVPFYILLLAAPVLAAVLPTEKQSPLTLDTNIEVSSGFDLDLNALRLVQFSPSSEPVWISELQKIHYKAQGINFFDLTDSPELGSLASVRARPKYVYPSPRAMKVVEPVLKALNRSNMEDNLHELTAFRTRYYRSQTGRESQLWLLARIQEITKEHASDELQSQISISEFPHPWSQSSIIVRINGSDSSDDSVVVVGAHQDSTNMWPFLPAPGADDDGSGTVTILEAYRGMIASGIRPSKTVEFHWYSAEEGGLLGSQAVAKDYESRNVNVIAMAQFDMTAWVKQGTKEVVGIINDYVDQDLTAFNMKLVDQYLDIPYAQTKCGYACSDHASWGKAGYPSVFTIESTFEDSNHYIHSVNDRIDISPEFSFDHMLQFCKLAAAFAIELGSA